MKGGSEVGRACMHRVKVCAAPETVASTHGCQAQVKVVPSLCSFTRWLLRYRLANSVTLITM